MASLLPFVDPLSRLENYLWQIHSYRDNPSYVLIAEINHLWRVHLTLRNRVIYAPSGKCLLKSVIHYIIKWIKNYNSFNHVDQLHVALEYLLCLVAECNILRLEAMNLNGWVIIHDKQHIFSLYTSGWKLCTRLQQLFVLSLCKCCEYLSYWNVPALDINIFTKEQNIMRENSLGMLKYHIKDTANERNTRLSSSYTTHLQTLEELYHTSHFKLKAIDESTWESYRDEAFRLLAPNSRTRVRQNEALYILLAIIELHPSTLTHQSLAKLHLNVGSIYLSFNNVKEAVWAFRTSLYLDPHNWRATFNLGLALARKGCYTEATKYLRETILVCSPDVIIVVDTLLVSIETIVLAMTDDAFQKTNEARQFTWNFLSALYLTTDDLHKECDSQNLLCKHSLSNQDKMMKNENQKLLRQNQVAPLEFHEVRGWRGVIGKLLHQLYVGAFCRSTVMADEFIKYDTLQTGYIHIDSFNLIVENVSGRKLYKIERDELYRLFKSEKLLYRILVPSVETMNVIREMKNPSEMFYAGMHWNLTLFRGKYGIFSKCLGNGLWYWLERTLRSWLQIALPDVEGADGRVISKERSRQTAKRLLVASGWHFPMDFLTKRTLLPTDLDIGLPLADVGEIVFRCNDACNSIRFEAAQILQKFLQKVTISRRVTAKKLRQLHSKKRLCSAHVLQEKLDQVEELHRKRIITNRLNELVETVVIIGRRNEQVSNEELHIFQNRVPFRTEIHQCNALR